MPESTSNTPCCPYCGSIENLTAEHVISCGLGCKAVLPDFICKSCNDVFGHEIEGPLQNDLAFWRNFLRIPGRDGRVADYKCEGRVDGQVVEVTFTGDGRVLIPPRPVRSAGDPANSRQFQVFKDGIERQIEINLRRKHGDLVWQRLGADDGRAMVETRATFHASVLSSPATNRCMTKYAMNLIAYKFGPRFVENRFGALKEYVRSGQYPGIPPAGIVWDEKLFRLMQTAPPKHGISIFIDGENHEAIVFLYLFFLFPFCIVLPDPKITVEVAASLCIDPYIGTLDPWLVTRFTPERDFCRLMARQQRGTEKQAAAAARAAQKWLLDVCETESADKNFHVCYSCTKLLDRIQETCPYCGQNSLPTCRKSG